MQLQISHNPFQVFNFSRVHFYYQLNSTDAFNGIQEIVRYIGFIMPMQKKEKVGLFKIRAHFAIWVVIANKVVINAEVCIIVGEKRIQQCSPIFFNKYGQIVFPAKNKVGVAVNKIGKPVIPEGTYNAYNIQAGIGAWLAYQLLFCHVNAFRQI